MKHILLEKYLLSEATNKRFILTEETAKDRLDKITTAITNIKAALNNLLGPQEEVIKITKEKLDQLEKELAAIPDVNDKQTKITQFVTALEGELTNIDADWRNKYKTIKNALHQTNNKDFIGLVKNVLTNIPKATTTLTADEQTTVKNTVAICDKLLQELTEKNITTDIGSIVSQLQSIEKDIKNNKGSITENCNKIVELLNKVKKDGAVELDDTRLAKIDWQAQLDAAGSDTAKRKAIWYGNPDSTSDVLKAGYYKAEWGDKADVIKSLGDAFYQEIKAFGFDERGNSFIAYLKLLFKLGVTINASIYGTVHNSFVRGRLDEKDLKGIGTFKLNNIIFCQSFYSSGALLADTYLNYQYELKNHYKGTMTDEIKDIDLSALYSNDAPRLQGAVFYTNGNLLNGTPGDRTAALRTQRDVRQALMDCFGEVKDDQPKAAFNVKKFGITKPEELIQACIFLQSRFTTDNNINAMMELFKAHPQLTAAKLNQNLVPKFLAAFKAFKIDEYNVVQCIKDIIKEGNIQ